VTALSKPLDVKTLFHALNTPYIVFGVNDPVFTVLEENDAHASIAMVTREQVIGRPLLEAFPDTSDEYVKTGTSQLLESIRKTIKTKRPDTMPRLQYDLRDKTGVLTKKYWNVSHHPVLDDDGRVTAVFQATKDITDEIAMSDRLDKTEHQLDQVLASSLIGTWSWDFSEGVVRTDANLARMFGIPVKTAKDGLPLSRFIESIHPKDQRAVQTAIDHTIETKAPFEAEYRTIAAKNETRWVIARGYVEVDKTNKPTIFSGVIVDITERKLAEQARIESENRLQFMADSMPQLVWITRPDGYHEYYNGQWYDYTGTEPGTTDGEGWNELFHPDDRERAWKAWRRSLKSGQPYEIEYRLYHAPSKTYRWVIGRALPFRDEAGAIVKWYGTCTDIDEQKRAANIQTFFADVSKQLSATLDYTKMLKKVTRISVPTVADWCSIDLYDEQKGFEQVSIAHVNPEKLSQARVFREHNPIDMSQPTGVPKVVRTGESEYYPYISDELLEQFEVEGERLKFMKSLKLHSIVIAPLKIADKTIGAISFVSSESGRYYTEDDRRMMEELASRISLGMTNSKLYADAQADLKSREKLEKELLDERQKLAIRVRERTEQLQLTNEGLRAEIKRRRETETNLARSNAELEDFAYVASHDLQEPLRKIQAFSDLLRSEYGDKLGEGSTYVDRMHAAALRMSTLIQDLLAFSRVSTKTNPPRRIELNDIVADVITDLEARIKDVDGTIKVADLPDIVADPTHMRQLFQNLIGNALKFHKPGTPPLVEVIADTSDKKFMQISVKDNGIGFDEKYLDRIFSVFQRLHGREVYDGTGIGLAVCRKIVERYGGTITAHSKKDNGATFIIRLPYAKEKTL
jgi:PAS domain S-box-containing protein